jgi:hypothetical protein
MRQENAFNYKPQGADRSHTVGVEIRFHDPFVLVYFEPEGRNIDGKLCHPPKLFVLTYSEEYDDIKPHCIDFAAAQALHPEAMSRVHGDLHVLRCRANPPTGRKLPETEEEDRKQLRRDQSDSPHAERLVAKWPLVAAAAPTGPVPGSLTYCDGR